MQFMGEVRVICTKMVQICNYKYFGMEVASFNTSKFKNLWGLKSAVMSLRIVQYNS